MLGMWAAGPRRSPRRSRSSRACCIPCPTSRSTPPGCWAPRPTPRPGCVCWGRGIRCRLGWRGAGSRSALAPASSRSSTVARSSRSTPAASTRAPRTWCWTTTWRSWSASPARSPARPRLPKPAPAASSLPATRGLGCGSPRPWRRGRHPRADRGPARPPAAARRGGRGRDRRRAQGRLDRPGAGRYRGSPHHRRSPVSGHPDHPGAPTLRPARAHPRRLRHPARRHPHWSPAMTTGPVLSEPAAEAAIGAACQVLHLPTVGAQAVELADQARRDRLVKEAKFPRVKRLADFDLSAAPGVAAATLAALASGTWIDHGTPLVLLGDSGTGKSHLLIGVGVAACEQGRAVRYVTCAALVNELVEAADERTLAKTIGRYARLDLLCCDELGYLHLDPRGAELLFQVITEREERASIAVASNAPFSEWGQTFTDPRLAAAVVDRLTFNAHIIQTGTQSYRLRATTSRKKGAATN